MESEKVHIAGHDMSRPTTDSKGQELVVLWITAGRYLYIDIDPLRFSREGCKKVAEVVFIDVAAKLFTMQYLRQFGEDCVGEKYPAFYLCSIQSQSWFRVRRQ